MDFAKDCSVIVKRLSWNDLEFDKLPLQSSKTSLVNLQRMAIKEEMDYEEDCNYDHLSKDDLINEVKAKNYRIRKLEAKCNVLISNMEKEKEKTTLTINKQLHEIERLNCVINDLERRIKDLMEKSGTHQLANVKTEPVENESGINGQELTVSIVMQQQPKEKIQRLLSTAAEIINDISQSLLDTEANKHKKSGNGSLEDAEAVNVQGILDKEDIIQESRPAVSEPQNVAEIGNANTETTITLEKAEKMGLITRITNVSVARLNRDSDSSPNLEVKNQIEMSPDTITESDSPREPLGNNINNSLLKSQSVSTEGITTGSQSVSTEDIKTGSQSVPTEDITTCVPELNVEVEKHLDYLSLDANIEIDLVAGALETDLADIQFKISLTEANETDNRENETMKPKFVDTKSLSVPVCVPKVEYHPNEPSELTSVSMESDLPLVPIEVEKNSSVSDSETFESVAPKYSEGNTASARSEIAGKSKNKKRSTRFKYSSEYKRGLQRHVRKGNKGKPFKCDQCHRAYAIRSGLNRHKRIHSGEKPFKCHLCDYAGTSKSTLKTHQLVHTSVEKPFKCDQCDYSCWSKGNLIKHERVHSGEKPFKCRQCDFGSRDKGSFVRHERIHSGEKPFKCHQCDYASSRKSSLITHQLDHSGEKPFKCDQCDYASKYKNALITHQLVHSGEKPFKCDQCDYVSKYKNALITHQLVHSGEKPFKCDQCGYASNYKSTLITHQRVHRDERPFKCHKCGYGFRQKSHLILHKRRNHRN